MTSPVGSVDVYCGHIMTILSQWTQSFSQNISFKAFHIKPCSSKIRHYIVCLFKQCIQRANKSASVWRVKVVSHCERQFSLPFQIQLSCGKFCSPNICESVCLNLFCNGIFSLHYFLLPYTTTSFYCEPPSIIYLHIHTFSIPHDGAS